jgi:hypothetical protein
MSVSSGPFVPDALDANRAGRLTDAQRQSLRGNSRGYRIGELQFAVGLTVAGLLIWFAPGPARYATTKPLIGIACIILAGFLVARSFIGADAVTRDLRNGRVDSAEGAISKWVQQSTGSSAASTYYISVAGQRVHASRAAYDAAPEAGIVKIYFLPNGRSLVNLERLPDRPLPADAMSDPMRALKDVARGIASHDSIQSAEARAEMAAIGNTLKAQVEGSPAAPPTGERDPRPLAEAIVGTWHNPMITLVFGGDGSLNIVTMGGRSRLGQWSVDGSGKLVSDAAGGREAADAWVAGNELTISMSGEAMKFEKAGR